MKRIQVRTSKATEMVDITEKVERAISEEEIAEGVCYLFVPHTTAGITINEGADPSVRQDILKELDQVIPREDDYRHTEGNAAAHIKASLVGSSVVVFLQGGKLCLGTWQSLYLCEFDGPRRREVWM
ncbi:MAG TPA: secondary thiamine-phosphate synthase enzyme YjbQ, partial [Candidatus Methylomirabilis sp.]